MNPWCCIYAWLVREHLSREQHRGGRWVKIAPAWDLGANRKERKEKRKGRFSQQERPASYALSYPNGVKSIREKARRGGDRVRRRGFGLS